MVEGSTPTTFREATLTLNGTPHGYAKGIKIGISATLVKEYTRDSPDPALLKQGSRSFPVSIDSLFIDSSKATLVLNGTPVSLVMTPVGGLTYTISNAILTNWELTASEPGALLQKVSGEGKGIAIA